MSCRRRDREVVRYTHALLHVHLFHDARYNCHCLHDSELLFLSRVGGGVIDIITENTRAASDAFLETVDEHEYEKVDKHEKVEVQQEVDVQQNLNEKSKQEDQAKEEMTEKTTQSQTEANTASSTRAVGDGEDQEQDVVMKYIFTM